MAEDYWPVRPTRVPIMVLRGLAQTEQGPSE